MRTQATLAAIAILAAGLLSPATGSAQTSPTSEQIVKSLTPTSINGPTRGIRLAPGSSAQPQGTASPPPAAASAPAVSLSVQFASGSAELSPQAMQLLDRLGRALTDQSLAAYRFRIEGHTDTVGSREYNKDLSDQRANAVVDYLSGKFHVDRSRVQAIGMGEDGLAVATPDQTPEPLNRRVQVVNIGS
jgi:OmpA-OmpF porin, OOP family